MRRRARVDGNHRAIVAALRAAGCSVLSAATLGRGAPDLVVGRAGATYLLEVKRPELRDHAPAGAERITLAWQQEWRDKWRGHVAVVYSPEDALREVGLSGAFTAETVAARKRTRSSLK